MWFQQIILALFTCLFVFGEDSFYHDFGDDFNEVFLSETGICTGFVPWIQDNYNTTSINPPIPESPLFVKPDTSYSCILSKNLTMSPGGQLQLSVYLSFDSLMDQITFSAYKSQDNILVGQITSSLTHTNYVHGWNTFNIIIEDSDSFIGFVAIVGRATSDSDIFVDHLQYLPPEEEGCDDESCEPVLLPCIDYDFNLGFEMLFDNNNAICANTEKWVRSSISDGITPRDVDAYSCISSPYISFSKGTLNVTVLIESESLFDSISVILNDNQDVFESVTYGKLTSGNITPESYTLEIPVDIEGYAKITFIGHATQGASVLVKSLKYMPSEWIDEPCISLLETSRQDTTADIIKK